MRLFVTPATILRWHRDILRWRWARMSRPGRNGRPPTCRNVRSAVLRLARENESWGYRRVHGELAAPGVTVAPSTVWQILKDAGIDPGGIGFRHLQGESLAGLRPVTRFGGRACKLPPDPGPVAHGHGLRGVARPFGQWRLMSVATVRKRLLITPGTARLPGAASGQPHELA